MKLISFFLLICCASYAHENKYVFIGQNGNEGKTAFVLELLGDEWHNNMYVNETGEVYLKVDRVVAIPKEDIKNFSAFNTQNNDEFYVYEEDMLECRNKIPEGPQKWRCPYCGYVWPFGQKCKNDKCATNRWENEEEKDSKKKSQPSQEE